MVGDYYMRVKVKRNDDQLVHGFKYAKKVKINGKWRYYYSTPSGRGGSFVEQYNKKENSGKGKYGLYNKKNQDGSTDVIKVQKTDKLFSQTDRDETIKGGKHITRHVGKIEQKYDELAPKINKVSKKTVKQAKKQINKGKKWIKNLFK